MQCLGTNSRNRHHIARWQYNIHSQHIGLLFSECRQWYSENNLTIADRIGLLLNNYTDKSLYCSVTKGFPTLQYKLCMSLQVKIVSHTRDTTNAASEPYKDVNAAKKPNTKPGTLAITIGQSHFFLKKPYPTQKVQLIPAIKGCRKLPLCPPRFCCIC